MVSKIISPGDKKSKLEGYTKGSTLQESIKEIKTDLSEFCLNGCSLPCCGLYGMTLTVSSDQFGLLYRDSIEASLPYRFAKALGREDITFDYLLQRKKQGLENKSQLSQLSEELNYCLKEITCPQYSPQNGRCNIHENPLRPNGCEDFPIALTKNYGVVMDARCPYIRKNWQEIISGIWRTSAEELNGLERKFTIAIPGLNGRHPYDAINDELTIRAKLEEIESNGFSP